MTRTIGATAALGLGLVALTACGGSDDPSEEAIEQLIENAAQQEGQDVDVEFDDEGNFSIQTEDGEFSIQTDGEGNINIQGGSDDGEITIDSDDGLTVIESDDGTAVIDSDDGETVIQTDDGTATFSQSADLPDDFPGGVPLPQGFTPQFTQSMSTPEGNSWVLGGAIAGDAAAVADAYLAQLAAAGFEQQVVTQAPGAVIFGFDNGEYAVNGAFATDPAQEPFLNLTVSPSQV